jgi:hypothetical protein
MSWAVDELSDIRALVAEILDDIGLRSYVFNIEQHENEWIVSADFPDREQWQTVDLHVDKDVLHDCLTQDKMREKLSSAWKNKLDRLT